MICPKPQKRVLKPSLVTRRIVSVDPGAFAPNLARIEPYLAPASLELSEPQPNAVQRGQDMRTTERTIQ